MSFGGEGGVSLFQTMTSWTLNSKDAVYFYAFIS